MGIHKKEIENSNKLNTTSDLNRIASNSAIGNEETHKEKEENDENNSDSEILYEAQDHGMTKGNDQQRLNNDNDLLEELYEENDDNMYALQTKGNMMDVPSNTVGIVNNDDEMNTNDEGQKVEEEDEMYELQIGQNDMETPKRTDYAKKTDQPSNSRKLSNVDNENEELFAEIKNNQQTTKSEITIDGGKKI